MNKKFLPNLVAVIMLLTTIGATAANVTVNADITTNTNWVNTNTYILIGDIIVKSGATLNIQEGTLIKGDKTTLSRLVIATGGKLVAKGTAEQPIVFTTNQAVGSRKRADWAGIAICGLAPVNFRDANGISIQGRIECGATSDYDYGGNIANDSSGVLSYVRIEYAGYVCGANSELNSLTLGGVGNRTLIDHVMVSFGQDDGFEFFGGTVNAKHLISYGSRDDDFDTDNGYSGKVQYGLVIRIDTVADQGDISNAFESDNDKDGTFNDPYTKGTFSNITVVGPAATKTSVIDAKFGWAARIRRSSGLNIFNSLFIGYKRGLRIEGSASQGKATADTLEFKNNIIAGCVEQHYETTYDSLYLLAQSSNTIIRGNANDTVKLVSPYGNPDNFNFLPQTGSPALAGAAFTNTKLAGLTPTTFRGAFGTTNWTNCWAEFSPQDEVYTSGPINYTPAVTLAETGTLPSLILTPTALSGATYNWSTGATTQTVTVAVAGTYTLTVTSAKGCVKILSTNIIPSSINDVANTIKTVRLFPNPNTGLATLQIASTNTINATITVSDVTGRDMTTFTKELNNGTNNITILTTDYAAGMYLVTVKNGAESNTLRMFVSK